MFFFLGFIYLLNFEFKGGNFEFKITRGSEDEDSDILNLGR